jgi:hypothetical protein
MEAAPGGIWQTRTAAAPAAAAERYAPVPHLQLCCLPVWQVADEWCLAELNKGWLTLNTAIIKNLTLTTVHSDGVGRTLHGGGGGQRTGRHRHIYSDGVGGTRHGGGGGRTGRHRHIHSDGVGGCTWDPAGGGAGGRDQAPTDTCQGKLIQVRIWAWSEGLNKSKAVGSAR